MEGGDFLDGLSDCQHLREDYTMQSVSVFVCVYMGV
jgi:hypothetical protein